MYWCLILALDMTEYTKLTLAMGIVSSVEIKNKGEEGQLEDGEVLEEQSKKSCVSYLWLLLLTIS